MYQESSSKPNEPTEMAVFASNLDQEVQSMREAADRLRKILSRLGRNIPEPPQASATGKISAVPNGNMDSLQTTLNSFQSYRGDIMQYLSKLEQVI